MSQSPPPVIQCPSCGRTNAVPAGEWRFKCGYCGETIKPGRVERSRSSNVLPISETPPEWMPSGTAGNPVPEWERSYRWHETRLHSGIGTSIMGLILGLGWVIFTVWMMVRISERGSADLLCTSTLLGSFVFGFYEILQSMCGLMNTTTLRLNSGWLQVHTGPLPWPRTRCLPVGEIRSLKVNWEIGATLRVTEYNTEIEKYEYCRLSAHLAKGERITLLDKFEYSAPLEKAAVELRQLLGL